MRENGDINQLAPDSPNLLPDGSSRPNANWKAVPFVVSLNLICALMRLEMMAGS